MQAALLGNQLGAVLIARVREQRRSAVMAGVVVLDLLALGVFKYYGFFAGEIGRSLDTVGLGMPLPLLELALPIGLSFITFQAISYVVDVKRGVIGPASTLDFGIYLSFFPHVVAGPIVRAREFIPQLATPRDPRNVAVGAAALTWGYLVVRGRAPHLRARGGAWYLEAALLFCGPVSLLLVALYPQDGGNAAQPGEIGGKDRRSDDGRLHAGSQWAVSPCACAGSGYGRRRR